MSKNRQRDKSFKLFEKRWNQAVEDSFVHECRNCVFFKSVNKHSDTSLNREGWTVTSNMTKDGDCQYPKPEWFIKYLNVHSSASDRPWHVNKHDGQFCALWLHKTIDEGSIS